MTKLVERSTHQQADDGPSCPAEELVVNGFRYRLVDQEQACPARLPGSRRETAATGLLTARERQIATLVGDGFVNKQIAGTLNISEWTVSTHLRRIYAKLGVDSRAAMVRLFIISQPSRPAPTATTERHILR